MGPCHDESGVIVPAKRERDRIMRLKGFCFETVERGLHRKAASARAWRKNAIAPDGRSSIESERSENVA